MMLLLVCICIASISGAAISAFAGINTNNPAGDGLIDNGTINMESFIVNEEAQESAYSMQMGNRTYVSTGHDHDGGIFSHNTPIPEADLVEGAKIVYQFDVYHWEPFWGSYLKMSFFNNALWMANNCITTRFDVNYFVANLYPADLEIYTVDANGTETKVANLADANTAIGLNTSVLNQQLAAGREYATYWIELDVAAETLTVYGGNREANVKTKYSVWKNAFTITPGYGSYFSSFGFACSTEYNEIDDFMVYSVKDGVEKLYQHYTFDVEETYNTYYVTGSGSIKSYDTAVIVNNPEEDASINSVNPLKVDTKLATTFELNAGYKFNTMAATRKVGVAFGLDKYNTALSAPKDGASFVYFTVNAEGALVLGADNIAADGTATAAGEQYVLDGIALGDTVEVEVLGQPDNSVKVVVNAAEYTFPGLKLNGHIGFAQTGTGDVNYSILPEMFNVTGYFLTENEGEAETASFDSGYISATKFAQQGLLSPAEYMVKQPTTVGEIDGLTTEGGRLNFRGTSTNTRVTFNQPYADFVFQFDYISEPFATRAIPAGLPTGGVPNRYSPFYVIFGSEQTISELALTYAIGIVEGNPAQYFWGAESLLSFEGKFGSGKVQVLANGQEVAAGTEDAITAYRPATGGGIESYSMLPAEGGIYSFYNKTTRCKLVVINNNVAMYVGEVNAEGGVDNYVLAYETKVDNSFGYVGFATDTPAWAAVDNVAITPISTQKAIELGVDAAPAVDLVADVAVADMENDQEPTPLGKTTITTDATAKALSWTAVEGAKEYNVIISLNNEKVVEQTVTELTYSYAALTAAGTYSVVIEAVPADAELNFTSRTTGSFTIAEPAPPADEPGDDEPGEEPAKKGCKGGMSAMGIGIIALFAGAMLAKKREN